MLARTGKDLGATTRASPDREDAMERKKVSSSQIRSVGYESGSQTLEVEMTDGTIWQYTRVPSEVHRRLMAAPTIATYYRDNIEEDYSRKRIR